MNYAILVIIGFILMVFGLVAFVLNFSKAAKETMSFNTDSFAKRATIHLVSMLIAGFGSVSAAAGFVWFLIDKYKG